MASDTTFALEHFKKNKAEEREDRKDKIILYIKKNPGQSIYKIAKELEIPRTSIPKLLDELIEEEEIKREIDFSPGTKREKFAYYIRTIDDFSFDNFSEENLKNKEFGKFTLRLMKSTQKNGNPFHLILNDGSKHLFSVNDNIEKHIKELIGIQF
ncbi:MAG: hypothetical protein HeimC2_40210 [Candidatus Heimdallarchaeota archaeon LC_2]|nr:MAG: hypothetical protein HeimC2_40210 [Candidatus Heimdallarchaeota archaeon LC_2]